MKTFEEWWMEGVQIGPEFEGDRTFKSCSRYFNLSGERAAWEACESQYKEKIKKLEEELLELKRK